MVVTRFHDIERISATVTFLTPTFLGGADQQAELRAAPFKSLLRQWWRVANPDPDNKTLLNKEGNLFGSVRDSYTHASAVRIYLEKTAPFGAVSTPFRFGTTYHPEVGAGMNVENSLYLGYGPVTYNQGLLFRNYLEPGRTANFVIDCPKTTAGTIRQALTLINAFGTIGSRSRNGYGSLAVSFTGSEGLNVATLGALDMATMMATNRAFPHGFGMDGHGFLCWQTNTGFPTWQDVLRQLAGIYLKTRINTNLGGGLSKRHILGYPVTHHDVGTWGGGQGRMPSQLRLMVKKTQDGRFVGRILHLPHMVAKKWLPALGSELSVWQDIHARLDAEPGLKRVGGVI